MSGVVLRGPERQEKAWRPSEKSGETKGISEKSTGVLRGHRIPWRHPR